MKKNKFLRLASIMLIACLATCCAVGGTFAKYVTSGNANDDARVAKFGVEITMTDYDMFKTSYDGTVIETGTTVDVVAPGTSGTLTGISITGAPEVKVEVKFEATLTLTGWVVDGDFYCPLEITVGSTIIKGIDCADAAVFKSAVETAINAYTAEYNANVDLATYAETPQVSWAWAFSTSAENDVKDTKLGDEAAAGSASTIDLKIVTTVTQVD